MESYLNLQAVADQYGFMYVVPRTEDPSKNLFWNATDACCDLFDWRSTIPTT